MKWIKASERMPKNAGKEFSVILRGTGFEPDQFGHAYLRPFVTIGFKNFDEHSPKFYFLIGDKSFLTNDNIEWLDESVEDQEELWEKVYDELNGSLVWDSETGCHLPLKMEKYLRDRYILIRK